MKTWTGTAWGRVDADEMGREGEGREDKARLGKAWLGKARQGREEQHFSATLKAGRLLPGHGGSWRNPGNPNTDSQTACGEARGQGETPGNKFSKSKGSSYKSKFQEVKQTLKEEQVWRHRGWAKPPWVRAHKVGKVKEVQPKHEKTNKDMQVAVAAPCL